jgi:hydroxyacylglutathione hydrolase
MGLLFESFEIGPLHNNTYLLADEDSGAAAVIDPSFRCQPVIHAALEHGWQITQIWLTHAHFDHIGGIAEIVRSVNPAPPVGLHPGDDDLWERRGNSSDFNLDFDPGPRPVIKFYHGQKLKLGKSELEVRHTPGHTRGHVIFYAAREKLLFCGDLIFNGSVGRTDLPGGDEFSLLHSIRTQVLTLPPDTLLLPGHGPSSTVGKEKDTNPFLQI